MLVARNRKGQSSIELVAGLLIMIPISLVLFDLSVVIACQQKNEAIARDAARAAARCIPSDGKYANYRQACADSFGSDGSNSADAISLANPSATAQSVVDTYKHNQGYVADLQMKFKNVSDNELLVETDMDVRLPAPIPGWSVVRIRAASHEAYTSIPYQTVAMTNQ